MPNPLISLLLLLGGADRPNEALRPQRHPAGEQRAPRSRRMRQSVPRRSARSECSSRSRSASTSAPPRCWQAATRWARSRSGSRCCCLRRPLPGLRIGLVAVALGATTYAAASALYLAAIERMGAGPAGVVSYCYPVLVMAGAIMLGRERLSRRRDGRARARGERRRAARRGRRAGRRQRAGRPARVRLGDASTRPTCSTSAALRDRVEPLALSTLVATGAAGAFAAAHAVHGGAPVHTRDGRARRASRWRSCRPPSPSRPSSPASAASGPRARASPPRSSRPSRSPAACSSWASGSCRCSSWAPAS